ncbi:unnamed protein product [Auanema sp. JU1783]|nr:unnamed protein product [Auanema sp. JU1783]
MLYLAFVFFISCLAEYNPCPSPDYDVYSTQYRRCYRSITFPRTFDASRDHCLSLGMFLEENPNSPDRRFISGMMKSEFGLKYQYWLRKELSRNGQEIICKTLTAKYPVSFSCQNYLPSVCVRQLDDLHQTLDMIELNETMVLPDLLSSSSNYTDIVMVILSNDIPLLKKEPKTIPKCTNDEWRLFEKSCYKMFRLREGQTEKDAMTVCESLNSTIVKSTSAKEKQFLDSLPVSEQTNKNRRLRLREVKECSYSQRTDGVFVPPLHDLNCLSLEQYFYCKLDSS